MLNDQALQQAIPATVVNAAAAVGTGNSAAFMGPHGRAGLLRDIEYVAEGTYTVCTANLEVSPDGGTTWVAQQSGIDLNAARVGTFKLAPGLKYRFNIATFTGTSITVQVVMA